jgi:CheY-like chemotaxis protein
MKILYVEDESFRKTWADWMRDAWKADVRDVRSREEAMGLIKAGFKPDVVLLDRGILDESDDDVAAAESGDHLYRQLRQRDIVVVMLCGDEIEHLEPYRSSPPLGMFTKPLSPTTFHAIKLLLEDT